MIDVPQRLIKIGSPSECNPESRGGGLSASPQEGITYHYPNAGIGIFYQRIVPERCVVRLVGTREREMNEITKFIFEKDNEE